MAKGQRTREAIIEHAMGVASRSGLDGVSIGILADDMNLSKSGVFAATTPGRFATHTRGSRVASRSRVETGSAHCPSSAHWHAVATSKRSIC